MDEFGRLAKDLGLRPQGKSAPMKSSGGDRRSRHSPSSATFSSDGNDIFNVFGGPPKYTNNNNSKSTSSMSDFDYNSIFKDSVSPNNHEPKTKPTSSNSPVYDKPVYDDDLFDGLPGIKSKPVSSSPSAKYDDNIFASMTSSPPNSSRQSDHFEDLFSNLGRTEKAEPIKHQTDQSPRGFDDLIHGFASDSPASGTSSNRWNPNPSPKSATKTKEKSNTVDDPFAVLESISTPVSSSQSLFTDPLEEISKIGKSKSTKSSSASVDMFGDIDSLNSFNKSPPSSTKETNNRGKFSEEESPVSREPIDESNQPIFDTPTVSRNSPTLNTDTSCHAGPSPKSEENVDIWLTVSEIPLFTPVTRAPPPSRPPPPIPTQSSPLHDFDNFVMGNNAQEVREREHIDASRSKVDRDEERIREIEKEERMKEIEREKKTREAVERATREARERAVNEARLKSERAAVQRAQAEARERAAVEAKERAERVREKAAAEKAGWEAKEKEAFEKAAVAKAQAEARRRAERAAVERVTAEARLRAASAAAKANQQKNDNDSFFNVGGGSRPNSVPKSRAASDSSTDTLSQERRAPEGAHRASSSAGVPSGVRKSSPNPNFVDDLSSILGGGAMPAGEFQEVEGETEERRRARLERQQRTQERAAKALAEKNERDMQSQKEQEERHRISTTLDLEIKRWAAGKEGNLRAMLSTLQYVLWPECGWQAIPLNELINGANVKKAYRKATLCIHPDKVQQKGANLQQKYVAEKVFDILKEAWNKFNSEELF